MRAWVHLKGAAFAVAILSALLLAARGRAQPPGDLPPTPPLPPAPPAPAVVPALPNVTAATNPPPAPVAQPFGGTSPFRPFSRPVARPAAPVPLASAPAPVVWDAMSKDYTAAPGEPTHQFTFSVTNASSSLAYIQKLRPSCGCTVATLPAEPWRLEPGAGGDVHISIDLRGKFGMITKFISVDGLVVERTNSVTRTNSFLQTLIIHVNIPTQNSAPQMTAMAPGLDDARRGQNVAMAKTDRQAVFKGDCASCHSAPAHGKSGGELFQAVCGVCHTSPHRASMVPDLAGLKPGVIRNEAYWQTWIESGRPGTLMPAFSDDPSIGGPLTAEQINSLAGYLAKTYPARGTPAK
jgi:mono/diheme cytochrome c family protein